VNALAPILANPRAALRALDILDARESFAAFCRMVEIPGAPMGAGLAAHHLELCTVLQAIDEGAVERAMFFLPPGSAKSTYGAVLFPPWFMARQRNRNVIVATYGSDLARKHGRRARGVVKQRAFRDVFGLELDPASKAADEWALSSGSQIGLSGEDESTGSEFMGGGIRSGMTGNRADLIIIDDPVKGREEAESETIRKRTLEAYQDDLRTRLKANGRIIIIQTRWHEEDLAGSILPEDYDGQSGWISCRDGRWWYVVCIPAEAESKDDPLGRQPGELLWPEYWPASHWIEPRQSARTWASLYQQRPRPAEGTFFQKGWFKRYAAGQAHPYLHVYLTSDHAPGGMADSDYSCVRVWGVDPEGDIWLLDGFRHQATMDVTADMVTGNLKNPSRPPGAPEIQGLIRRWRPYCWFPEGDNNWKAIAGFVTRRLREESLGCRIEAISPHGADKAAKAQAFQGMAASGRVYLPEGPMGDDVLDQYLKFPLGAHDDEVDAAGVIGRVLDMAHPAIVPHTAGKEDRKRYQKKTGAGSTPWGS
jgi:predicted phage terminase large subunit-like protein